MSKCPIFYYWLKNEKTGEKKRTITFEYLGDIGEKSAEDWVIEDWCMEEEDFA